MKMTVPWASPRPAATEREYLDRLGKALLPRLPFPQVREVLSDYQERFAAGRKQDRSEASLLQTLGAPEEAAALFLEENPPTGVMRHNLLWGALLALCLVYFRYFILMAYTQMAACLSGALFLVLTAGALFVLLRGGARAELERQFPPERTPSPALLFGLPLAVAAAFEAALQLMVSNAAAVAEALHLPYPGLLVQLMCFGLAGAMALLALWWGVQSVRVSIRYFPGVVHAMALALAGLTSLMPFLSMDLEKPLSLALESLLAFLPYLAGLAAALAFRRWLDTQFPACFRQRGGGQQDYLDQLGKHLLRWFPAAQILEILSDYREQFELGLERGKSEAALVEELGPPETVARDLLAAESPLLRRTARKRDLRRSLLLIPAAYGLAGMFALYEFGYQWAFLPEGAPVFLALGTAAMFALLHGRDRVVVEAAFPPERGKPPVWVHLLPLVIVLLTAAAFGYLLAGIPTLLQVYREYPLGAIFANLLELPFLILGVLLVWTLFWSFSRSIRYLPAAVHAAGGLLGLMETACLLRGIDPSGGDPLSTERIARILLTAFSPYLAALALMACLGVVLRACARRGKEG